MKIAGIIAEYNPFHKGHEYQIRYTREVLGADYVIAVMSGDFVQRGTPALLPKHVRAEMALRSGIDLVLELPASVSCASAEFFAQGGVSLLDGLGVVDMLCFGSEEGEMTLFYMIADILKEEPESYRLTLQNLLKKGMPFPAARSEALRTYFSQYPSAVSAEKLQNFLSTPNNILGLEYCKALCRLNSSIRPVTLKRIGSGYHDTSLDHPAAPSASGIREYLKKPELKATQEQAVKNALEQLIPASALTVFSRMVADGVWLCEDDLDVLLHYRLLSETAEGLCQYLDLSPDLAARIIRLRNQYQGFTQFTELLKTKELTYTRIQRALLHIVLNLRDAQTDVPYARVLGFRKSAGPLLKEIKKEGKIPLVTKLSDTEKQADSASLRLLHETVYTSNIYECLLSKKAGRSFAHEYEKQIVII